MLREFCLWLFKQRSEPFDIAFLNIWHITFMLIIFGGTIAGAAVLSKKSEEAKTRVCRILAYVVPLLYVADFFIMPLARESFTIDTDKLPFHICTLLGIVAPFVQFNKKFNFLNEPVALLSIVAPMMYICYPGTAIGDISPFCYKIIQTFLYHGALFAWGFMRIATRAVVPNVKNCYKALLFILGVAAWAGLGNAVHDDYNWFFLKGGIIPLPESIEPYLAPVITVSAVFAMVMLIYGIYYAFMVIKNKYSSNRPMLEEKETATV